MHGRSLGYAALVVAALATRTATAQPENASEEQRTALYREGVALANAGRWDDAVKKFRQVVAIRSAPPALFTLGQAEEHTGQLAAAERTYEKALTGARTAHTADVAAAAEKALSAIEPRIPRLIIKLAHPAEGAAATLDGTACALDEPIKVDPGARAIAVRAPGRRTFESKVTLAEGQSLNVTATLVRETAPAVAPSVAPPATGPTPDEAPPPPEPEAHSSFPTGPVVLGSVGVVAGVVGLVVRLTGQSSYDSASASCGAAGCPTQQVADDANGARTQIIAGTVVLGVGVAAVAFAGIWWAILPKDSSSTAAHVGVGMAPRGEGATAALRGTF